MFFSNFQVLPSETLALNTRVNALRAAGEDIINLAAGESFSPTPPWIKQAGIEAIQKNYTRYTAVGGIDALKHAILKKVKNDHDLTYTMDEVMVSNGAKQAIFNALMATLCSEDEVIVLAPYWGSYKSMVELFGAKTVTVLGNASNNFKVDPEAIEKAITSQTKWIIFNAPSNPCGTMYTEEELRRLAGVFEKHPNVHVISDDIYAPFVYDEAPPFLTLGQVAPALKERILLVSGVSKAYNMTGWRIGYACGSAALVKRMTALQSQSTTNPCSIAQYAALSALTEDQSFLKDVAKDLQKKRDILIEGLHRIGMFSAQKPQGPFYIYANVEKLLKYFETDEAVCLYFLEEAKVAMVPGAAFGLSPYMRISFSAEEKDLHKALARMAVAVEKLSAKGAAHNG